MHRPEGPSLYPSDPIGERVRLLRVARGVSQVELAQRLEMAGNGQVSKLENGRTSVDERILVQLAAALDCTPEFFLRPRRDLIATRPWLRAYADAPAKTVESIAADNTVHREVVTELELKRMPDRIPAFDADPNDDHAIELFAQEVRAAADLDEDAVVRNAMRAVERLGCVVLPLDDEVGRHLGVSQYVDQVPYIRASRARASVPGDRQRFTVLHELGHLALHATQPPPETADDARRIEAQAHRFAGAFLTPRDALLEDLHAQNNGRVTLTTLQRLKSNWGVAIKMLVVRLRQLGEVSDDQATSLYKQISKRGWNTGEPVEVPNESAIWFSRALESRWGTDDVMVSRAGLSSADLRRWTSWLPRLEDDEASNVVSLAARRASRAAP